MGVKSRYVVRLFFTTLLVGGVTTIFTGFFVRWEDFLGYFSDFAIVQLLSTASWLFGVGLIFGVISQMGFFAYLMIHRFGLGVFKSAKLWNSVQLILVAIGLFDLVYFRYAAFGEGQNLLPYIGVALIILLFGLIIAFAKAKITNSSAFIPALFFMVVATIIEWTPVLQVNEENWLSLMLYPLLICNSYQLLILQRLNERSANSVVVGNKQAVQ